MTIAAKVRNVRGCEHADLALDPIALVAGVNATGKSSIAQSIAAALSGETLPIEGLNKSTAGYLVRTGAGNARVEVQGAHGSVSVDWPAASPLTVGDAPGASLWATGLWSLATVSAKERARVLSLYLKADPTLEDVQEALREHEWPDDVIAMVWKQIEQQGWDAALEKFRQRGAENKGRWRQLTGVNYGSRIAATYRPDLSLTSTRTSSPMPWRRRDGMPKPRRRGSRIGIRTRAAGSRVGHPGRPQQSARQRPAGGPALRRSLASGTASPAGASGCRAAADGVLPALWRRGHHRADQSDDCAANEVRHTDR
jgi:hypothetical protein